MESSTHRSSKRRGLTKTKLIMTLYRATKHTVNSNAANSANVHSYGTKSKPNASSTQFDHQYPIMTKPVPKVPGSSSASAAPGLIIVNQDRVLSQEHKPKVAFARKLPDSSYAKLENFYAHDDEAVDAKAAKYISSVQERFRLEHVDS